jgi:membrane-associated phospholipid phosphatase
MNSILLFIGENGPIILFFISLLLLLNKYILILYYIIGFIINLLLNIVIKNIIKEPRPTNKYQKNFEKRIKAVSSDTYGMPSGHAQSIFYSLIFIHKSFNNIYLSLFYLLICLNTLHQRVNMGYHSISQVIVGAIIGLIVGYIVYNFSQKDKKK